MADSLATNLQLFIPRKPDKYSDDDVRTNFLEVENWSGRLTTQYPEIVFDTGKATTPVATFVSTRRHCRTPLGIQGMLCSVHGVGSSATTVQLYKNGVTLVGQVIIATGSNMNYGFFTDNLIPLTDYFQVVCTGAGTGALGLSIQVFIKI